MTRMVDALVARDVEAAKMRKGIEELAVRLDNTVSFLKGEPLSYGKSHTMKQSLSSTL